MYLIESVTRFCSVLILGTVGGAIAACNPSHYGSNGGLKSSISIFPDHGQGTVKFSIPPQFINGRYTPWATNIQPAGNVYCWDKSDGIVVSAEFVESNIQPWYGAFPAQPYSLSTDKRVITITRAATPTPDGKDESVRLYPTPCACTTPRYTTESITLTQTEGGTISYSGYRSIYSPYGFWVYFKAAPNSEWKLTRWIYGGDWTNSAPGLETDHVQAGVSTTSSPSSPLSYWNEKAKAAFAPTERMSYALVLN